MKLQMKKVRVGRGVSQKEIADLVGMPVRRYGSYERGERAISLDDAARIADVLQCSLDELAGRDEYVGKFSDQQQAQLNAMYEQLDTAGKSAAVGSVNGILDQQARQNAREKTGSDGVSVDSRRTA